MEQVRHHTPGRATATPRPAATAPIVVTTAAHVQLQGALRVSSPRDPAEREADATAQRVMRMPAPSAAASALSQRSEAPSLARFTESAQAMRSRPASPIIARKGVGTARVTSGVAAEIANSKAAGAPLPASVQNFMAPRFGADFSAVRVHTGDRAAKLNQHLAAHAFTHGQHIFFGKDKWKPDTHEGKELLAHELTHTIQQGAVLQRSADVTVTEAADSSVVQLLGLGDVLDYFADKANAIPGFRMFTIVLGVNPVNMAAVDRSAANILRAVVEFMPGGILLTKALDTYGVFEKAGAWIEGQLQSLGLSGASIKQSLMDFLNSLGLTDLLSPSSVWEKAKFHLTAPVEKTVRFVTALAGALLDLIKDAILRPLAALAADTPSWDLLCAVLGKNPITGDKVPRTAETLIGPFMKLIGQEEIWENIKKANAIARCYAWFQGALAGLMGFVQQIPGLFIDALKSLEIAEIVVLPAALVKVGKAFAGFVARFTTWAGTTIWNLLEIVFAVVAPGVMPYVQKAAGAFRTILKNPIGFVGNLVAAGKLGLNQFVGNFLKHLKAALIGWLTGALSGAGVYIPQALALAEIGKFVLSVLGISWPQIRAKIVKVLPGGETTMKALETGFDIVKALITGGPAAAWEVIKQKLSDLKDMVIQTIIDYVKDKVVTAAVTKLLSMLSPVGAFIQAIIGIYNTVMFFIERMRQIAQVAASVIDSIAAIAAGQISGAANKVESTMAGLLTLVISFLARIAGLGKVSDAVVKFIKNVQAKVDAGIDFAVKWIVDKAKGLFKALFGRRKNKDIAKNVFGLAQSALLKKFAAKPTKKDVASIVGSVLSEFKSQGLKNLSLGPESKNGEIAIYAEVNPKKKVADLKQDVPADRTVTCKVRLQLAEGIEVPKAISKIKVMEDKQARINEANKLNNETETKILAIFGNHSSDLKERYRKAPDERAKKMCIAQLPHNYSISVMDIMKQHDLDLSAQSRNAPHKEVQVEHLVGTLPGEPQPQGQLLEPATQTTGRGVRGGGTVKSDKNVVEMITWNTSGKISLNDTGNQSHAESQILHWLDNLNANHKEKDQKDPWSRGITGIEINMNLSPCTQCIETLNNIKALAAANCEARVTWSGVYRDKSDGSKTTTEVNINALKGWQASGPVAVPDGTATVEVNIKPSPL